MRFSLTETSACSVFLQAFFLFIGNLRNKTLQDDNVSKVE